MSIKRNSPDNPSTEEKTAQSLLQNMNKLSVTLEWQHDKYETLSFLQNFLQEVSDGQFRNFCEMARLLSFLCTGD